MIQKISNYDVQLFFFNRLAAKIIKATLTRLFSLKFTVENTKYFQINQPYIVICNHQSALDLLGKKLKYIFEKLRENIKIDAFLSFKL